MRYRALRYTKKNNAIETMTLFRSRRSFLKVGLIGSITLAGAGGIYRLMRPATTATKFKLDGAAASALASIIPVILKDAIVPSPTAIDTATSRVVGAISGLPLSTQKEIQDLFGLLSFGAARRLLAGVPDQWHNARPEDVAAFLQSWRVHRLGMLQSAYAALHDLILGAWYTNEASWAAIGYPGPMKELS